MNDNFRTDPLALANLVGGTWDKLPHRNWSLETAVPLKGLINPNIRRQNKGLLYSLKPNTLKDQLELATKSPDKWSLITADKAQVPSLGEVGVLRVPSLRVARDNMAIASRDSYSGKVIAVTGSVGKTTIRRMLDTTLKARHSLHTSNKIENGFSELRNQLLSLKNEEYATFEIARIALPGGEKLAKPDIAIISALAEAHMEDLGSIKDIAQLKAQLLLGIPESGTGIINIDSPHVDEVMKIAAEQTIQTITYGEHIDADIRLVSYEPKNSTCHVSVFGREYSYQMATSGRHNAVNSLAVLGTLNTLGLPIEDYLEALSSFTPVRGRGKTHEVSFGTSTITVVDECYNANPTSMRAALRGFDDSYSERRKVLVLGDMLELGSTSFELHAALSEVIIPLEPSVVILIGTQMKALYDKLPQHQETIYVEDVEQLGNSVASRLKDGDAVFLKASNGMNLRSVVNDLTRKDGENSGIG